MLDSKETPIIKEAMKSSHECKEILEHQQKLQETTMTMQKLVAQKTQQLWKLQNAVISILADLVDCRDEVTGGHVFRTQKYLGRLIDKLLEEGVYTDQLLAWDLDFVIPSAQLHDLGKLCIKDTLLHKPGPLSQAEFHEIKSHVDIGVDAITRMERLADNQNFLFHAKLFAGTHHEKWDGTGYPNHLSGHQIPLEGRLMAIVDVYDALISMRPYKQALTPAQAKAVIIEGRGTQFDPQIVDVFAMVADEFAMFADTGSAPCC